jgi:dienelactone hydrolase
MKLLAFLIISLVLPHPAGFAKPKSVQIILKDTILLGDNVSLRVVGLPPGKQVAITAEMIDRSGRIWRSTANFISTNRGEIDVSKQAPLASSYSGVDPLGLFWSMADTKEVSQDKSMFDTDLATSVTFRVADEGKLLAEARQKRWRQAPGITSTEVRDKGLVATFFKPQGDRPRPGIILVGGSEGGIGWQTNTGALLASHGYATLALAYFGMEGVGKSLQKIPLEYCQEAITWMTAQSSVDSRHLAVIGVSKGGELALLLGSWFPQIKAVAAYVPSAVVFQCTAPGFPRVSSWSFKGEELPFVPYAPSERFQKSRKLVDLYEASLENKEAFDKAVIQVEKIQGPILLISGKDDSLWPSTRMSDMVIARLKHHKFRYAYTHVAYDGAGHGIAPPGYAPTANTLRLGGGLQGNAHAQAKGWKELLAFLARSLKG